MNSIEHFINGKITKGSSQRKSNVFNPATFFFQLDKEKKELELAIVEVNNTFGEAHTYVLDKQKLDKTVSVFFNKKEFHVSPFADMQGHYKFKFDLNENQINISIHLIKNDTPIITANFNGYKTNFANSTLLKSFNLRCLYLL